MGIEIDFISVVIGYVVGVFLTWSLTFTLYGCDNDNETETSSERMYNRFHPWDNNVYTCSSDRRIM